MNVLLGVVWVAAVGVLYWLDVIAGRPAVALIILAAACCAAVVAACRIRDERESWKQLQRDRGSVNVHAAITTLALLTAICIAGWLVAVAIHNTLGAL